MKAHKNTIEAKHLLKQGNVIGAIRLLRDSNNIPLKEAKEIVESWIVDARHKLRSGGHRPGGVTR